jgi:hypothetical protein
MTATQFGREQIFFRILVFFSIITALTGIINLTNTGVITLGDLGSGDYMQNIPGQAVPNVGVQSTSSSASAETFGPQDFTTTSGYNENLTKIGSNSFSGDYWTQYDGIGYQATYTDIQYPGWATMELYGLSPTDNVYDVTYHVNNQFGNYPFYSLVKGSETGSNYMSGFYIKYDQSSVSIVHSAAVGTPLYSVTYAGANTASTVETVYDSEQGAVAVYVDGNFAATFSNVEYGGTTLKNGGGAASNSGVFYCGLAASHWGLSVSGIDGTFVFEEPFSFWGDIMDKINGLVVFAKQVIALASAFFGLTSNALVPFWLWAIIALPCIATLVLIYIQIARGD